MPQKPFKATKASRRDKIIARQLLEGKGVKESCIKAGYSANYARCHGTALARRAQELVDMDVKDEELSKIAKATAWGLMVSPETLDPVKAKVCMGIISGPSMHQELHFHQHHPPQFWDMMKGKMKELLAAEGTVVDAESN